MQSQSRLKTFYRSFTFEMIPTTIGATGAVPYILKNTWKIGIEGINDDTEMPRHGSIGNDENSKTIVRNQ